MCNVHDRGKNMFAIETVGLPVLSPESGKTGSSKVHSTTQFTHYTIRHVVSLLLI